MLSAVPLVVLLARVGVGGREAAGVERHWYTRWHQPDGVVVYGALSIAYITYTDIHPVGLTTAL